MITDSSGGVRWANSAFGELTGYTVDELAGQSAGILDADGEAHRLDDILHSVVGSSQVWKGELAGRRKDGATCRIGWAIAPVPDSTGKVTGLFWTAAAVPSHSADREAETRLRAQNERFERIIENTEAGYFRIGMDGCYQEVNPAWLRMHGFARREDAIGLHFSAVQNPADSARAAEIAEVLMRGEPVASGEFSRLRADGTVGYHNFSANPVLDEGRVTGVEGFLVDITGLKAAELEMRQTEQRYRSLFNSMQEGVAVHKLICTGGVPDNYMLLDVNVRYEEILGVKRADVVNQLATGVYGTPEAPYLKEYASVVATGEPFQFETYFAPMDKHFVISATSMGGDLFATIFFDVTGQKKSEEALKQAGEAAARAERHYRLMFNCGSDAFFVYKVGPDGLPGPFLEVNDNACRSLGYTREELLQMRIFDVSAPDNSPSPSAMNERLLAGDRLFSERTYLAKDGRRVPVEINAHVFDLDGSPAIITSARDITERKEAELARAKLEEQLRQSQKLESVGRLAGGVAHDFNNLLTVINGYCDLLLGELEAPGSLRGYAEAIRKAGERATGLTKQLLAFSRKQVIEPRLLDLNAAIRDSAPMLQRLIGEDVRLETRLDGSLGQVMADPDQIHQVLMNLAVNARDAMPDGGCLDIETGNVDVAEEGSAAIHPDAVPGRYVLMSVSDTGSGMDATVRQHIFEPFFTTKESGKGTGLGLSTVYGIVRQSGGWIEVRSEAGAGTQFNVYLPRLDGCAVPERSAPSASTGGGSETILIVEDQPAVRSFTKAVLKRQGYQVVEASSGEEAITAARRHPGRIHLLLTDVVLPGINGRELSVELSAVRQDMRVLFISGYTADVIAHRGVLDRGVAFLQKPFTPDELAEKVRTVLASPFRHSPLPANEDKPGTAL